MAANDRVHVGARLPRELYETVAVRMITEQLNWQQLFEAAAEMFAADEWTPTVKD